MESGLSTVFGPRQKQQSFQIELAGQSSATQTISNLLLLLTMGFHPVSCRRTEHSPMLSKRAGIGLPNGFMAWSYARLEIPRIHTGASVGVSTGASMPSRPSHAFGTFFRLCASYWYKVRS